MTDRLSQSLARMSAKRKQARVTKEEAVAARMARLRDGMPEVAGFLEFMRESFGEDCRLVYAEENGERLLAGRRARMLGLDEYV